MGIIMTGQRLMRGQLSSKCFPRKLKRQKFDIDFGLVFTRDGKVDDGQAVEGLVVALQDLTRQDRDDGVDICAAISNMKVCAN